MKWFRGAKATHDKHVEEGLRLAVALYEKTRPGSSSALAALRFSLKDSQYRYLLFCLSTMQVACSSKMENHDAVMNECFGLMVQLAATEQAQQFFGGAIAPQEAANRGAEYLRQFLHRWSAWVSTSEGSNPRAATNIVVGMLHSAETDASPLEGDAERLWPMAEWIESALPVMREAFDRD